MSALLQITDGDMVALAAFRAKHPTWWYTIGVCNRSRDFTAGPHATSPEHALAEVGNGFDLGFSCDHDDTLADAIADVMRQIEEATP